MTIDWSALEKTKEAVVREAVPGVWWEFNPYRDLYFMYTGTEPSDILARGTSVLELWPMAYEQRTVQSYVAAHRTQEAKLCNCLLGHCHLTTGFTTSGGFICKNGGTQEAPAEAQEQAEYSPEHITLLDALTARTKDVSIDPTQPTRSAAERERTWVPVYVERAICDLIPDEIGREIARDGWGWDDKHPDCRNALNRWKNEAIRQRVELIAFKALTGHELEAKHDAR